MSDHLHRCLFCRATWTCEGGVTTVEGPVEDECADCTAKHPPSRRFLEGYLILTGAGLATARILAAAKVSNLPLTGNVEVQTVYLRPAERERVQNLGWWNPDGSASRTWRWRNP